MKVAFHAVLTVQRDTPPQRPVVMAEAAIGVVFTARPQPSMQATARTAGDTEGGRGYCGAQQPGSEATWLPCPERWVHGIARPLGPRDDRMGPRIFIQGGSAAGRY